MCYMYSWISMIILMLFTRVYLRLKTTNDPKWANYRDLRLELDEDGKHFTRLYDKRDDLDFHIVNVPYLSSNIPESPACGDFVSQLHTLCSGLFEIWRFSVQRIYSGFKVIEAGIFFTETSDYFLEILWSSYRPCSQIWHFCVTYVEGFVHKLWHMTGFPVNLSYTWRVPHVGQTMLTLSGTPDSLTLGSSLYIHYWKCQSKDYGYGLMTVFFAWISITVLSWAYFTKTFGIKLLE